MLFALFVVYYLGNSSPHFTHPTYILLAKKYPRSNELVGQNPLLACHTGHGPSLLFHGLCAA